jgi:RNA polymerase sigma factor (sigma-70 family)
MIEPLEYSPVISDILKKLKVKPQHKEDLTQECYVALIEKRKHLDHGIKIGKGKEYAALICRSRILDLWDKESPRNAEDKLEKVRFESLSDPSVYRKAAKVWATEEVQPCATKDELEDAILSLQFDEYRVIYERYVEEKTLEETASAIGSNVPAVWRLEQKGIEGLKKYFEVS